MDFRTLITNAAFATPLTNGYRFGKAMRKTYREAHGSQQPYYLRLLNGYNLGRRLGEVYRPQKARNRISQASDGEMLEKFRRAAYKAPKHQIRPGFGYRPDPKQPKEKQLKQPLNPYTPTQKQLERLQQLPHYSRFLRKQSMVAATYKSAQFFDNLQDRASSSEEEAGQKSIDDFANKAVQNARGTATDYRRSHKGGYRYDLDPEFSQRTLNDYNAHLKSRFGDNAREASRLPDAYRSAITEKLHDPSTMRLRPGEYAQMLEDYNAELKSRFGDNAREASRLPDHYRNAVTKTLHQPGTNNAGPGTNNTGPAALKPTLSPYQRYLQSRSGLQKRLL
jgi:hypothetical protein